MNREFFEKLKFHEESYNKIQVYSKSFIGTLNNNIGYGKNKIDALIDLIVKTAKIQRYGNSLLSYDKSQDKKGNYKIIFYNVVNEPIFTLDFDKHGQAYSFHGADMTPPNTLSDGDKIVILKEILQSK